MENTGKSVAYKKQITNFNNVEKASPIGYYFAAFIIILVLAIYTIADIGTASDKDQVLSLVGDSLLLVGTIAFLFTSLYGYVKAKNLRIQDSMFAFSMASLSFCIASFVRAYYDMFSGNSVPFPSFVDVFFLVGSLALIGAIYSATKAVGETSGIKVELHAIIILLAVVATFAIVGTYVSFTDILRGGMTPTAFISIAYPTLDIICLALVGNLILISWGRSVFEAQAIIALGAGVLSISHIYFSILTSMNYFRYEPLALTLYGTAYMFYAIGISRYVDLTKFDLILDRLTKLNNRQQ